MNPQQVKVLKAQRSLINWDSDTLPEYQDNSDQPVTL